MSALRKYLPRIVAVLAVVGVGVLVPLLIQDFLGQQAPAKAKRIQQITLLRPPPPPPPPPKVEKPPEPEIEEEVKAPEPEEVEPLPQLADAPPPGDALGLDAEGGGAGDNFGLLARKGGRGLLQGAGDPFMYYASQLQRRIEDALAADERLRRRAYSVVARVWVRSDGRILRAELAGSTGDGVTDGEMLEAIQRISPLAAAPPPDMPMPIRLRVTSVL